MNREGFTFRSEVCDKSCGTNHKAGIHRYKLQDIPTITKEIRDNDTLPPIKTAEGRWIPNPIYKKETIPRYAQA